MAVRLLVVLRQWRLRSERLFVYPMFWLGSCWSQTRLEQEAARTIATMRQITLMMPSAPVCCNIVTGFTTGRACTCALLQTHSRLQENDWFRRGYDRLSKFPECNGLVLSTFHRRGVNSDASQSLHNI